LSYGSRDLILTSVCERCRRQCIFMLIAEEAWKYHEKWESMFALMDWEDRVAYQNESCLYQCVLSWTWKISIVHAVVDRNQIEEVPPTDL